MVQDVFDPELFLDRFEHVLATGERGTGCGRYRDQVNPQP